MSSPKISFPSGVHSLWQFRYLSLAIGAALLLWNLNYAPIWNPDEGRYISASLEMISPLDGSTPDWAVPHLNTLPRLNKPPLVYWCGATLFKILGPSVTSARLVSALAAIGVLLLLWRLGAAAFGDKTGLLAALIWVSCALPFALARMLSTDMLLAFAMTLALFGIYKIATQKQAGIAVLNATAITGIGLGLALLAKGPVGVALPLSILAAWLLLIQIKKSQTPESESEASKLKSPPSFATRALVLVSLACLIAGVLAAPWYLAVGRAHPEFLQKFVFGENVARLTGSTAYHDAKPFWFYIPVLIVSLLPWTLFLWPAFKNLCASLFTREKAAWSTPLLGGQGAARWFLWLWACAVIVLFSISHTKLVTYILPALPPLALLIADAFTNRSGEKAVRQAAKMTMLLLGLFALLLPILFSTPRLLADKIVTQSEAWPFVALMSAILILGIVGLWQALRAREGSSFALRAASTLVATGAVLFMALTAFMSRVAPYEDASPMLIALRPFLQPGDKIVQFKTFQPSAMYYTDAPSTIVDFVNTSGLDEERFNSSPFFPKDHKVLQTLFQSPHRVYVLARWKHAHWPTLPPHYVVAANNDYRLLSNRSAPQGFSFDFVAPAKRHRVLSPACKALSPEC